MRYFIASFLMLAFFLLEYTWIPWEDVPIYYNVPFIYDGGAVRLDSWVYNASVKIEHFIVPLVLFILTPFKRESKLMMLAFGLCLVEFFFTWNEPFFKIPLPFDLWIPISTSLLKFASICNFMYVALMKWINERL